MINHNSSLIIFISLGVRNKQNTIIKAGTKTNTKSTVLASCCLPKMVSLAFLILPHAKATVSTLLVEKTSKALDVLSSSNNTLKNRINEM